jgi:transposase, IS5 family
MRQKRDNVLCFEWSACGASELKIVRMRREEYKRISEILDENPAVLDLAAQDLKFLSRGGRKGRSAVYTAENLERALIVHGREGLDLRGTVILIAESPFLQDFVRLGNRPVMDFTFLDKAFQAVRPQTWKRINEALGGYAVEKKRIAPKAVRVDTTVVETTIHYPTDCSLLWDSWRVVARLLRQARAVAAHWCTHRFHDRLVKRAYHRIVRYSKSRAAGRKRLVRRCWRELIGHVRWIAAIAGEFCARSRCSADLIVQGIAGELEGFLRSIRVVVATAERANLKGEVVPAGDRVFSLFEPHTELIKRGKSQKPVEFGHVVMLSETKEKFISDYDTMKHRIPDPYLTSTVVERHERLFGEPPKALTGDHGFNPEASVRQTLEEKVATLAIPRKLSDWAEVIGSTWQRFRAGIEGSISVLKRAFRLQRCPYRGFKSFAASVGLSIFCHNLVALARPPGK